MAESYDVVVIGGGVMGAATAFHLAKLRAGSVALFERGQLCRGGTAKSCAILRTHYSIPTNTQLALKSLEVFRDFRDALEDDEADCGFVNCGYLILGGAGETADKLRPNLALQAGAGAETLAISREEARARHPLLALEDVAAIGYEPRSGYADPYLTTMGFLKAARRLGAVVQSERPVGGLLRRGGSIVGVRTPRGEVEAGAVVALIGPWTAELGRWIGVDLPLQLSRHIVLTFRAAAPYQRTLPVVKDMTTANKMYFRPASGGVALVGSGDHGDPLERADDIDDRVELDFIAHQGAQLSHRMPSFAAARFVLSWTGPYDITPDWNPVLGAIPGLDGLTVGFGFSGHGFKLAPAIGKVLAQAVLGLEPEVDIAPYRLGRFAEGEPLTGAYGIGSIS
ncbi:MAG: FAD-binding oxidoreductase [Alphaproteobacteria bacterium]|nr:FAD-binding oxidoreductase [Alphaproteobacteria bacterium]